MTLTLQNPARSRSLPPTTLLRRWARAAAGQPIKVNVRVVDRHEGRRLNHRFRGKNHATNVLTFVYDNPISTCLPLTGDLVLCAPVVRAEARAQGKPLAAHYAHLLVHGLLHLQGHDHANDREARRMEDLERRILSGLGFDDPYADRDAPIGKGAIP